MGSEIIKQFAKKTRILSSKSDVDISSFSRLKLFASSLPAKPSLIINAAAYTDVNNAEKNKEKAWRVNVEGTKNLAKIAKEFDIPLIHISSDYVFDGEKTQAYTEEDAVNPLNFYGKTKAESENVLRSTWKKHYIFRTSWLYGEGSKNFVAKITDIIKANEKNKKVATLKVVTDEKSSPTWTVELAAIIETACEKKIEYGTYHAAGGGISSRFEAAKEISSLLKSRYTKIIPCLAQDFSKDLSPLRPKFSALKCTKLENKIGMKMKAWKISLREFFENKEKR